VGRVAELGSLGRNYSSQPLFQITMKMTLTVCSSLLALLGVLVGLFVFPDSEAWLPLIVFTYAFFFHAAWLARPLLLQAVVLIVTLTSVCVAFWCFWEARLSPWHMSIAPLVVIMVEYLAAGTVWFIARRFVSGSIGPNHPLQRTAGSRLGLQSKLIGPPSLSLGR
jgi:hypothetical protein